MTNYNDKFLQIFDYLSAPELPDSSHPGIVFGRNDTLVADAAAGLAAASLANVLVITGGVGKDSGDILRKGYRSEAHFLGDRVAERAAMQPTELPPVILEEKAGHGAENAEFSMRLLKESGFALDSLIGVMHATSARRLAAGIEFQAQTKFGIAPRVYRVPTNYAFEPADPVDQKEAIGELLRLANWPAEGKLFAQPDLPQDLVDFAKDVNGDKKTPTLPSPLVSAVFRRLPKQVKHRLLQRPAKD